MPLFIYFLILLVLRGRGGGSSLCFIFLLHLTCGRRKGKAHVFFRFFFFIVEWVGGSGFFFFKNVEGGWEGEGVYFIGSGSH